MDAGERKHGFLLAAINKTNVLGTVSADYVRGLGEKQKAKQLNACGSPSE